MSNQGVRRNGPVKLRLTVLCAKNLAKKDFFRLPDPFAKVVVDGSGQCHSTDTVRNTLDPKWNQHYDLSVFPASDPWPLPLLQEMANMPQKADGSVGLAEFHLATPPYPAPSAFRRYIGKADSITISVWNHKKIHKKQGAGFLGCVRLLSNAINRLKDTG
eukprot:superscaffoldBa00004230_g18500